jgi:hypothetical protein
LSLVALDAMKNCRGYDPNDKHMSGMFQTMSPKILKPASLRDIRAKLEACRERDPHPPVADAIEVILSHLDRIVEPVR